MSETTVAALRQDANALLLRLPEETLALVVKLMQRLVGQGGQEHQHTRTTKRKAGIAAGKFVVPDDIDADNEMIASWFEGKA